MSDDNEFAALRREVAELKADVKDLVEAWRTAKGIVALVKWVGALATAVTAVWAMFKLGKS